MIAVEEISKSYRIGLKSKDSLWENTAARLSSLAKLKLPATSNYEEFWALKDVSFNISEGEVVGIIGKNGAGKSTLLKILSRITPPTSGRIRLQGRLASLLEVGTGFHPDLTGRENIFLNGAILGMSNSYMRRVFDEIVDFSEIEKFIDTPVKHYSSGMYVRLAFAVAAYMDPEILVIDEVLAVGDIGFQNKCLGKIGEVGESGKTVLFVSHNLALVKHLCQRAILLESGQLTSDGPASEVIARYRQNVEASMDLILAYHVDQDRLDNRRNDQPAFVSQIEILDNDFTPAVTIRTGDRIIIRIYYHSEMKYRAPAFRVRINTWTKDELIRLSTTPISGFDVEDIQGDGYIDLTIDSLPLTGGEYFIDIGIARENVEWIVDYEDIVSFRVTPSDVYGSGMALENSRGYFVVSHSWSMQHTNPEGQKIERG